MSNLRDRRIPQEPSANRVSNQRTVSPNQVPQVDRNQLYRQNLVNQTPKAANGQPNPQTDLDYQDGYVQGRVHEQSIETNLRERDNQNAARGMLLGIVFASLASAIIAALFISNQNQTSTPVIPAAPVAVPANPQNSSPAPSPQTNTQVRERIIERTQEVVPIPQAPASSNSQQGSVNPASGNQSTQAAPAAQPPSTQPQGQVSQPQTQTNPSIQRTQVQGTGTQVAPLQGVQSQGTGTQTGIESTETSSGTSAQ